MTFYVYILESISSKRFYIGYTHDISQRLNRHNSKREKSTKANAPWKIIFYKSFENRKEAMRYEKYLKSIKKRVYISRLVASSENLKARGF